MYHRRFFHKYYIESPIRLQEPFLLLMQPTLRTFLWQGAIAVNRPWFPDRDTAKLAAP